MLKNNVVFEVQKRYALGQRDFSKAELRKVDLQGVNLSRIDLQGADLSYANLKDADLSYADLRGCYLNEANLIGAKLKGANLEGAYLIRAYLTRANFDEACLKGAFLTGAYLTKVHLNKADLTGAYLTGVELNGAELKGALYSEKTCFEPGFDPKLAGMEKKSALNTPRKKKITAAELVATFNLVAGCSKQYLGNALTVKYFDSSRPNLDWLQNFKINNLALISFAGAGEATVTTIQLKWFQKWVDSFVKSCSLIVHDFAKIVAEKQQKEENYILVG
ncbi:MAG: pentapeptide repeat-containing protein [Gomphosphaeria aponina SAG 52.96 = DSM 107014]|uniref:Pentapeptide repeat-containing protein n=1 Tax=Gomphosphaeria aponina SAG 52.96 = DSM 107014 TaxID=1521640 RepID=A0A941JS59_9CHRO|nr:pentapeptide repeat-containing protein [Gomphosphaeria aponina SAG 52.96 = DSM 107014]